MSIFEELKRRRVFRVAAMYAVGAWAVIQVATTIFPQLGFPDWSARAVTILAIAGFPVALILSWLYDVKRRTIPVVALIFLAAAGFYIKTMPVHVDENSVVVLPFADESDKHDQAYFSDGITEEILNSLARVSGLRVPGRTTSFSFKGKDVPASQIAQQLKVGNVLAGSVQKVGDRVHITASLVDAKADKQLWSDTYDRQLSDVFAVQREIAKAIVDKLRLQLTQSQTDETKSPQAHEQYLKGLYYWNRRYKSELPMALDAFKAATQEDPKYARAWAGIALAYAVLPQYDTAYHHDDAARAGRAAAKHALELDPKSAEAHAALSQIALELEWKFADAKAEAQEALKLNPQWATAHQWYAETLLSYRQCDAAFAEMQRAQQIDPLSSVIEHLRGVTLAICDRPEESVEVMRDLVQRDPAYAAPHSNGFFYSLFLKKYADAEQFATDSMQVMFARALARGDKPALEKIMRVAKQKASNIQLFGGYRAMEEPDSALTYLNKAVDEWAPSTAMYVVGSYKDYHDRPLWQQAAKKMNLPLR